jgi:hypothetical protein
MITLTISHLPAVQSETALLSKLPKMFLEF